MFCPDVETFEVCFESFILHHSLNVLSFDMESIIVTNHLIIREEPAKLNALIVSQIHRCKQQVSVQFSHFTSLVIEIESKLEATICIQSLLCDKVV